MPESPMVGARLSADWQQLFQAIAAASGRKEAFVVREAITQYLGRTDPVSVKGLIALPARAGSQPGAKASGIGAISWLDKESTGNKFKWEKSRI